jgi:uncharacterized membrane protein YdjX (TVP38/TMEM64 family)
MTMLTSIVTFAVCLAGGFFPAISVDLYLLGAAAIAAPGTLPLLVIVATVGQVAGKGAAYLAAGQLASGRVAAGIAGGRAVRRLTSGRVLPRRRDRAGTADRDATDSPSVADVRTHTRFHARAVAPLRSLQRRTSRRARGFIRRRPGLACVVVMISALTSVPPFFAVAAACGALHIGFGRFVVAAFAGRVIRTAAIVAFPSLLTGPS